MALPSFAGGVGLESGCSAAVVLARFSKSWSFSSLKPWQVAPLFAGRPVAGPGGWRRRAAPSPAAPLSPGPAAAAPCTWGLAGSQRPGRESLPFWELPAAPPRGTESPQGAGACCSLPSSPEGSSGTPHHASSPHLTPETPMCDAAGKERAHVNTANE